MANIKRLAMMRKKSEEEMDSIYDPRENAADPSSFVEEGAPDSFADLDAKLKVRDS